MIQAARQWIDAKTKQTGGDAIALVGLASVLDAPLTVVIDDKAQVRTLADWCNPRRNADGSVRKGEQGAIRDAAIRAYFGIETDDIPNAVKAGFGRVIRGAAFIARENLALTLNKRNEIEGVPLGYASAAALFDEKGALTKQGVKSAKALRTAVRMASPALTPDEAFEAACDQLPGTPVTVDGREHPMFGKVRTPTQLATLLSGLAVDKGYCAPVAKRKARAGEDTEAAKGFAASLDQVASIVTDWADPDGETDIAPSAGLLAKARKAYAALGAFLESEDAEPAH